ncbi:hypothetical protein [Prosthecobacter sp.]|uniref:hypothetical protein n=1 Tax=Prosthecobacter sp. TaxID=1965333 RepID=UPI0037839C5A
MSYRAVIHDLTTGRFLLRCDVEAHDLHEAENAAISKAALVTRGHPGDMDVRHLHERASRSFVQATDAQGVSCVP